MLHATARGVFTASVNGAPVSDEVLSPGWSSYEWRLRYRSYDVADLLAPRTAVLGLALATAGTAAGWAGAGRRAYYGRSWAPWRSWRSSSPTGTGRRWHRRVVDGGPVGGARQRPLRRPDRSMPACVDDAWQRAGVRR